MTSRAKRVEEIFLEVVDLQPESRNEIIEQRCDGDDSLKDRVLRLLQADAVNSDGTLGEAIADFAQDQIPRQIGAYLVHGSAGEGGMGSVFDATHTATGRRAAVKLIRAGIASQRGRERFRIEAETLGRLSDPGIAQVYDAGAADVTYPDGVKSRRPFIAMEFVEGVSVIEFARRNNSSRRERLELIVKALRAIHHAHQRGVIHRDLKPNNILVTDVGQPKIVDFGIARLMDSKADTITVTGQVLGTIRYMSPEQASGDAARVDTRADVYSIGSILYELIADRPVIEPGTGSTLGAAVQLLSGAPKRLSQIAPDVPHDLEAIVHKAIERDVEHRYGSAQVFADDLERFLAGRDVTARSPTRFERFSRSVRRNKPLSAAVLIAFVAVLAGSIISTTSALAAKRQARLAKQEADAKTHALNEAQASLDYLTDILASCTPERDGRDARVLDVAMRAATKIKERFKDRPLVLSSVQLALARTLLSLGKGQEAYQQSVAAFDTRKSLLGPDNLDTVEAEAVMNEAAIDIGGGPEIRVNFPHPPEWLAAHLGPEHRDTLRAQMALIESDSQFGYVDTGFNLLKQTCDTLRRVYGPDDDQTLDAETQLGFWLVFRVGRPHDAIPLMREVMDIRARRYGPQNARTLDAIEFLAAALNAVGEYKQSLDLLEPNVQAFVEHYGEGHPETSLMLRLLAEALRYSGRPAEAQKAYERAITSCAEAFGDSDGRTESTRVRMAEMWLEQGRIDEAAIVVHKALQDELIGGAAGGNLAIAIDGTARVLLARHKPEAALVRFDAALAGVGSPHDLAHKLPSWADIAYWTGQCLMDLHRPADAAQCWKDCASVYERCLGPNSPRAILTRTRYAEASQHVAEQTTPLNLPTSYVLQLDDELVRYEQMAIIAMEENLPMVAVDWLHHAIRKAQDLRAPDDTFERLRKLLKEAESRARTMPPVGIPPAKP